MFIRILSLKCRNIKPEFKFEGKWKRTKRNTATCYLCGSKNKMKNSITNGLSFLKHTYHSKTLTANISKYIFLQDLSLKGFWLQKWLSSEKATECRNMIDYLLCLAREGKLKYEYVCLNRQYLL